MGRIKERKELKDRRGPGRKARKQAAPAIPSPEDALGVKQGQVGGRIKQRARRRSKLITAAKAAREEMARKKQERRKSVKSLEEEAPILVEGADRPVGYSDDNQKWLKPIIKSGKQDLLDGGSDGNSTDDEGTVILNRLSCKIYVQP